MGEKRKRQKQKEEEKKPLILLRCKNIVFCLFVCLLVCVVFFFFSITATLRFKACIVIHAATSLLIVTPWMGNV